MNTNLALVKSEMFGAVQCDFYQNENGDLFMTGEQLGGALEYAEPVKSISNLVGRNPHLDNPEFSVVIKLMSTDGKFYSKRVFTEDGVYEVTMLSKTEKGALLRAFARKIFKALRKGNAHLITGNPQDQEIKYLRAKAMATNAEVRKAKLMMETAKAGTLCLEAVELLTINAMEILTGDHALPRPKVDMTYSAEEVGKEVGLSANAVGRLANKHNLKTDEYGMTVLDKSRSSDSQFPTFRYNEKGKAEIVRLANVQRIHACN